MCHKTYVMSTSLTSKHTWLAVAKDVPADGSCMYHAIGYVFKISGGYLRNKVASIIRNYPDLVLHGQSLRTWIEWDVGLDPHKYSKQVENGLWGGSFEMTILSSILSLPIYVYEPKGNVCVRISESIPDDIMKKNICSFKDQIMFEKLTKPPFVCILFIGKSHYMYLDTQNMV